MQTTTTLRWATALIVSIAAQAAVANSIIIPTTIRDFTESHPDFEGNIDGLQTGKVSATLGVDNKPVPVFTENQGGSSFTTHANFNQWYNDVGGVNQSTAYNLVLNETATPGEYEFSSSSFFPIDGQLYGNEGNSHNYHFTLELHTAFTYKAGQTFEFTGDDDLWLFIDDKLALDLGGVHSAVNGVVDLDTLGLTVGQNYSFDLFFAERHTSQSNFKVTTAGIEFISVPDTGATLPLLGVALGALAFLRRRS